MKFCSERILRQSRWQRMRCIKVERMDASYFIKLFLLQILLHKRTKANHRKNSSSLKMLGDNDFDNKEKQTSLHSTDHEESSVISLVSLNTIYNRSIEQSIDVRSLQIFRSVISSSQSDVNISQQEIENFQLMQNQL